MCDKELLLGVSQRKWLSLLSKDAINLRVRDFLEEEEALMVVVVVEESSAFLLFFFLFLRVPHGSLLVSSGAAGTTQPAGHHM